MPDTATSQNNINTDHLFNNKRHNYTGVKRVNKMGVIHRIVYDHYLETF